MVYTDLSLLVKSVLFAYTFSCNSNIMYSVSLNLPNAKSQTAALIVDSLV